MKCRLAFAVTALLLLSSTGMFAQQDNQESASDVAFWVAFWSHPRVAVFGPEQVAFNSNIQEILFPYDDHTEPSNPSALDDDARWLKEHANDRFYINGYASSRGELIYNLVLSQRRANYVKRELVSRGVPESQIVLAVGWGELYPVCPEKNDECWKQNRRVRLSYSPN
jgi:outer membrane protein OmpA-like peptidoglycan-associated protein